MSQHYPPPPPIEQYPGYFPSAKRPFWTRTKVGVVTGVLGLVIGAAGAAGGDAPADDQQPPAAAASIEGLSETEVDERVDEAVDAATADLEEQLADLAAQAAADVQAAEDAAAAAAAKAVAKVKRQARAAQRQAVQQAIADERARAEADSGPAIQPFAGDGGGTDPRYGTCGEANDNGYGSYVSGVDPEYAWYDDRDGDGVVCEF